MQPHHYLNTAAVRGDHYSWHPATIQPWICAPGTYYYGWVNPGSVESKVFLAVLPMNISGN